MHIKDLSGKYAEKNDPKLIKQIHKQEQTKTNIQKVIDDIDYYAGAHVNIIHSKDTSVEKLKNIQGVLQYDQFKNTPELDNIRKTTEAFSSQMNHELKRLDRKNENDRDGIRNNMVFKKEDAGRPVSINTSIDTAIAHNTAMLMKLKEQKDFTDDPTTNKNRIAKYEKSDTMLLKLQEDAAIILKNPVNPVVARTLLGNIQTYAKDKSLPETTRNFMNEVHGQLHKFVLEEKVKINNDAKAQQKLSKKQDDQPKQDTHQARK